MPQKKIFLVTVDIQYHISIKYTPEQLNIHMPYDVITINVITNVTIRRYDVIDYIPQERC